MKIEFDWCVTCKRQVKHSVSTYPIVENILHKKRVCRMCGRVTYDKYKIMLDHVGYERPPEGLSEIVDV